MKTEPAITVASIVALVGAVITLLVVFGVEITEEQTKAILAFVTIAGPIAVGVWARFKVVSPATDAERSKQAYLDGVLGKEPSVPVE